MLLGRDLVVLEQLAKVSKPFATRENEEQLGEILAGRRLPGGLLRRLDGLDLCSRGQTFWYLGHGLLEVFLVEGLVPPGLAVVRIDHLDSSVKTLLVLLW